MEILKIILESILFAALVSACSLIAYQVLFDD